jgi:hypothetical protein
MTYAVGGLIQAADYNNLVGGNPTDVAGTLNRVWAIGQNDRGYGQTAVSQISTGNTVTAAQWASLLNNLNNAYRHSTNTSGTGLTAPTTGTIILFISTLSGYITDIFNNRLSATSTGSTTTGTYSYGQSAAGGSAATGSATRTVTFSSVDQCRYFWNAGGRITFDVTSVSNNNGSARSGSIVTLANTNFNAKTVLARSAQTRTGTGGASVTDVTASGFYNLTTGYTTFFSCNGQTYPYTGDSCQFRLLTNGTAGSYGGNGNVITLYFETVSGSAGTGPTPTSDPLDVTVNYSITVTYPSTSYLSNSWGTATIA